MTDLVHCYSDLKLFWRGKDNSPWQDTLQIGRSKNTVHTNEVLFSITQMKHDNGLRAVAWALLTYNISGGWRMGENLTKQEAGWKYEQMEPKVKRS
jgi:hypothetical protein